MDALEEIDAGNYTCMASLPSTNVTLQKHFFLKINNRKGHCGKNHFSCNSETCIHQRYVCDGRLDCADGEDESERNCGTSPCQGKLTCDGRCIPVSWCCQQFIDANCTATVRLACCSEIHKPYIDSDNGISSADQQRLNDIHFLQTTIYIVIGSAIAFMLVVTILVVTICRTHMKRTVLSARYPVTDRRSRPNNVNNQLRYPYHLRNPLSLHHRLETEIYDLDLYLNRSSGLNCLVTYNINNGVQFVGHPVEPPPYSEVISLPPREGPPPPYVSRENVCRQGQTESDALLENASAAPSNQERNVESSDETYFWPRIAVRRCSSSDDTLSEENRTVRPSDSSDSSDNPMPNSG
ncbi:low-density lipoprotein receptor class A domain-containing protein 3-like [Nilaparvata lugens]|uniref:low-density lipoprotein receptor class A domain-containing protein 3-like n=1 Tax=Nilaparvata lugens TaxID=108931 RepID=UPI00193E3781|nr:low-density lipoprotein receptor class A domain-containing protein 3-like [Nilaparvata lugens]